MDCLSLPFQIQLELTRPWWLLGLAVAAGPGLLLLPQPGRFRALAAGALALAARRRSWSCWSWRWRPEPAAADPRAVRRLRRGPERERRRRRGTRRPTTSSRKAAAHAGSNRFAVLPFAAEPGSVRDGPAAVKALEKAAATAEPATPAATDARGRTASEPADARGSTARGPTWPRRSRWRRRRSRRSTSRGSCCFPTATPTAGDALKAAAAMRGKVEVLTDAAARPRPTPRSSSRPSTPRRRSSRASRSTSRS